MSDAPAPARLEPARFDAATHAWRAGELAPPPVPLRELRLVTWNVWFDELAQAERAAALLDDVRACDADVVCLQEVTPPFLEQLLHATWVRDAYLVSHARGELVGGYGVVLLSRLPLTALASWPLPTAMGRRLVTAQLAIADAPLVIAAVHLESRDENAGMRGAQLAAAQPLLRGLGDDVVLCGDFNFDATSLAENARLDDDFADVWPLLNPHDPGYTVDSDDNPLRALTGRGHKRRRYDRVLLRSATGKWRARAIRLVGHTPLARDKRILPSDHFGLCATLARAG